MSDLQQELNKLDNPPTIRGYYDDVIAKYDTKFAVRPMSISRMGVCPLHDDNDPSFGVVTTKQGVEIYNCFGCGKRGTLIDLVINSVEIWEKRTLTKEAALRELAKRYGFDAEEIISQADTKTDYKERYATIAKKVQAPLKPGIHTFKNSVEYGLTKGYSSDYFSREVAKLLGGGY